MKQEPRICVKPELHRILRDYAQQTGRKIYAVANDLLEIGLLAKGVTQPDEPKAESKQKDYC